MFASNKFHLNRPGHELHLNWQLEFSRKEGPNLIWIFKTKPTYLKPLGSSAKPTSIFLLWVLNLKKMKAWRARMHIFSWNFGHMENKSIYLNFLGWEGDILTLSKLGKQHMVDGQLKGNCEICFFISRAKEPSIYCHIRPQHKEMDATVQPHSLPDDRTRSWWCEDTQGQKTHSVKRKLIQHSPKNNPLGQKNYSLGDEKRGWRHRVELKGKKCKEKKYISGALDGSQRWDGWPLRARLVSYQIIKILFFYS